jgi:hypothetical protein
MALRSTQSLTEMSTRNLPRRKGRPARKADNRADNLTATYEPTVYEMWQPRRLTTLWASTVCYTDNFTLSDFLPIIFLVKFDVLTQMGMKSCTFWDTMPCCPVKVNRRLRRTNRLQLQHQREANGKQSSAWLTWPEYSALYPRKQKSSIIVCSGFYFFPMMWLMSSVNIHIYWLKATQNTYHIYHGMNI